MTVCPVLVTLESDLRIIAHASRGKARPCRDVLNEEESVTQRDCIQRPWVVWTEAAPVNGYFGRRRIIAMLSLAVSDFIYIKPLISIIMTYYVWAIDGKRQGLEEVSSSNSREIALGGGDKARRQNGRHLKERHTNVCAGATTPINQGYDQGPRHKASA